MTLYTNLALRESMYVGAGVYMCMVVGWTRVCVCMCVYAYVCIYLSPYRSRDIFGLESLILPC